MPVTRSPRRLLREERGQIAMAFIALMGLVVLLTPPLMNLGEVAKMKTRTAIASDAGALSGASWGGSAGNEGARRAQLSQWIYWIAQSYLAVPFCLQALFIAVAMAALAGTMIQAITEASNIMMIEIFHLGFNDAFFTALDNSGVDDTLGVVDVERQNMLAAVSAPYPDPSFQVRDLYALPYQFNWVREGIIDEPSWVSVDVAYPTIPPQVRLGGFPLVIMWYVPGCWLFFCIFWWGWNFGNPAALGAMQAAMFAFNALPLPAKFVNANAGVGGLTWANPVRDFGTAMSNMFSFGPCGYPALFPLPIPTPFQRPSSISNADGNVTVTVRRHREPGAMVAWWTMNYPDLMSQATARYAGAHIRLNPFRAGDRATVELIDIEP